MLTIPAAIQTLLTSKMMVGDNRPYRNIDYRGYANRREHGRPTVVDGLG